MSPHRSLGHMGLGFDVNKVINVQVVEFAASDPAESLEEEQETTRPQEQPGHVAERFAERSG